MTPVRAGDQRASAFLGFAMGKMVLATIAIAVFVGVAALISYPLLRQSMDGHRISSGLAKMKLQPGASYRFFPAPLLGMAGYEIKLKPFPASQPCSLDQTLYGVPDTRAFISVNWRIPPREAWESSQSQVDYQITVNGITHKTRCKWSAMRGAESGVPAWTDLYADVSSMIFDAPHGTPIHITATYTPGPGEPLDYQIQPVISSGGWE
jgi:hypothetical protein